MKSFKINEQQIQQIGSILMELPAKNVLNVLDFLRNLPLLEDENLDKNIQ